jgi:hypothetical protein
MQRRSEIEGVRTDGELNGPGVHLMPRSGRVADAACGSGLWIPERRQTDRVDPVTLAGKGAPSNRQNELTPNIRTEGGGRRMEIRANDRTLLTDGGGTSPTTGRGMRDNNTSASGTPGQFGLVPRAEPEHIGSGFRKPPIYTCVQMLKTGPKTCHFLPLFAARGGHRARKPRAASRIVTRGSGLDYTWSSDARKKWQIRAAKWHNSTPLLFTKFRERAEAGNRGAGGIVERAAERQEGRSDAGHWNTRRVLRGPLQWGAALAVPRGRPWGRSDAGHWNEGCEGRTLDLVAATGLRRIECDVNGSKRDRHSQVSMGSRVASSSRSASKTSSFVTPVAARR